MNTAIDIPVFVNQEALKEIAISRLKKQMTVHHLPNSKVKELGKDIEDLKRLRANGLLDSEDFKRCWKRAYRKYQAMVVELGHHIRTGGSDE